MISRIKSLNIFYGWWIVAACFFIGLYVAGVVFYGFTALFEPIADEFGWSYAQISAAASLRGLEMGIMAPVVGMLVDRLGPRRLIFGGATVSTIGLVILSQTHSLLVFYVAFIFLAVGVSTTAQTVLLTAVSNWFQKRVGLATGIAIAGFGFGGLLIPLIVKLIDWYDWRVTVLILAAGMVLLVLPLSLVVRHKPEHYGYLPDGAQGKQDISGGTVPPIESGRNIDVPVRKAIAGRAFWTLSFVFVVHTMLAIGLITHVMPYLSSIGVTRSVAGLMATSIALLSVIGRIGFGWLGDLMDKRHVAAFCLAMMALGIFCFGCTPYLGGWLLIPFLILFSIGFGGSNVQRAILVRELFGRKSFGAVFGLMIGINTLGSIIGPVAAGWAYDHWEGHEGYQFIWFVFVALAVVALLLVLTVPHRKSSAG